MSINKIGLDDDGFKIAFLEGKLSIDCPEIKLIQKGATEPKVYTSPGFILINPENGAEARLVCKRDPGTPYNPFANIMQASSVNSGELFPDSHYYRLEATDVAGNIWTNPAVMLKVDHLINAEILTFTCDYIEAGIVTQSDMEFAHFVFSEDLDFPLNIQTTSKELVRGKERITIKPTLSSGMVSGMQTHYYKSTADKGGQAFELISLAIVDQPAPEGFDERLLESIRFCSATMASPVMSEVSRAGQRLIRLAKAKPLNNGLVSPPLLGRETSQDFYQLMGCYYDYACKNVNGHDGAPLSAKLGGLFTLKGVWLETIALLLCVTSEGILDDPLFKALGKPNASVLVLIKELFDWVRKAPVESSLRERALSAMGSMKSNRAVDKMYALARIGAIDERDIVSWKVLRNPSAHGSFEVDADKLQELLDHIHRLITLIYKLVFLKIGYTGKYSDYSRRGWGLCDYDAQVFLKALEGEV